MTRVRNAANENMMGRTSPDQSKQQWTGPLLLQLNEDPLPVPAVPEKVEPVITAKPGTMQATIQARVKAVSIAGETVSQQYADEAEYMKNHATNSANATAQAEELKNGVKTAYSNRLSGDVTLPK